ncbi:MAG TPA: hypothetical protein VF777_12810 [Phycisphaerales bacterium]
MMTELLILLHFAASAYLAGLIWVIQIVHYPMLEELDPQRAAAVCARHSRVITPIVAPAMLIELGAAVLMLPPLGVVEASQRLGPWLWVSAGLVVVIWVSTFAVQVPLHARLQRQAPGEVDTYVVRQLVRTNWVRTVCWSVRAVLAGWFVWELMHPLLMRD